MTIKVYASIMPGEPDEVYEDHGLTVEQWVKSHTQDYQPGSAQPVTCSINGALVSPMDWADVVIGERDSVEFRVVPRGSSLRRIAGALTFGFSELFFQGVDLIQGLLTPDIPGQRGAGEQGQRLNAADARANTARLGEGVPEVFGQYIRYPDYLNQPRRIYIDEETQELRLMLSVGVGSHVVDPDQVKIGQTPISEIQSASYEIFEPGADVSGTPNHENWFAAPEVGGTSSSSGLRLKGVSLDERSYNGSATGAADNLQGVTVGDLWEDGIHGSIKMTQSVTVAAGATEFDRNIITGNFQHLVAGLTVNVESDRNANGSYLVHSINAGKTEIELSAINGAPIYTLFIGSGAMAIDKAGTRYVLDEIVSPTEISVARQLANGDPDPDWDGMLPQASLTVGIAWEALSMSANTAGPFFVCPEGELTSRFEVDIFAPQGLGTVDGESINTRTRTIKVEYREIGESAWLEEEFTVSGRTRNQLGWTFGVDLPEPQRVEVRVSRIGQESVATTALDRIEFTALRSRLPTVTSYDGITTMAVTITGSDKIASASNNQVNLVPLRKLEPVAGGTEEPTRSISRAAAYVAKSLGYTPDQLDVEELERLDDLWAARGDTFDYVFSSGTAKDAIDTILRAGFAEMTLDNGVITPVRDEPRTQFEQGYSPENMTAPLQRSFTGKVPDEADGVEVEYTKAGTWTTETVMCLLPGDQQTKVDKIKLDGVTDRTRAWRIGMRRRRAQRYRRWTYSFNTELDALNSNYLSYVPLIDDIPGYGKVAILTSISEGRITVSEPLEWQEGQSHVIAYRDENGDTVGPFPATRGPDDYTVFAEIPQPWPAVLPSDREQTHVYFGTTERWHFPALITEISPSGPLQVGVTATNYDDRVYSDDNSSPP